MLHCSTAPFEALYDAIAKNEINVRHDLINELLDDLVSLLVVKEKSSASRKSLESGELKFSDGSIYKVNKTFIENSITLSDQLNIDEIFAAETLFYATSNEKKVLGTSFIDSAMASYYTRRDYIVQIISYYLCSSNENNQNDDMQNENNLLIKYPSDKKLLIDGISKTQNYAVSKILESFKSIEKELKLIKESVDRSKILGTFHEHSLEMKIINYRRNALYNQYQSLGEILWGCITTFSGSQNSFSVDNFIQILDHVSTFDPQDICSLCFIPCLFTYVLKLDLLPSSDVEKLHSKVIDYINDVDKLSENPFKCLISLAFLTKFIDWCKQDPSRTAKFEFVSSVDKPMQVCISIGALEQLLTICADTSVLEDSASHFDRPFYDFRTFLQQHIPKLIPVQLFDIDQSETLKLKRSIQQQKLTGDDIFDENVIVYSINNDIKLSKHFIDFLIPIISDFIDSFISTAAFMMTQLRDTEEDMLLSSETFDLEVLTENADLERLYMSMFYLYNGRNEYSERIWSDTNSAAYGFLQWASRCNSPLIMATFSMLLSSLAGNDENAINVFSFLQSTNSNNHNLLSNPRENSTLLTKYPSISWSTIYSTLSYYCNALAKASETTFQNISNEPLNLRSRKPLVTELGEDSIIYISGFFQVLSQVARNSPKARVELLESDNNQLFVILVNLLNMNTSLNGSIMVLLSSLVGDSLDERTKFWQVLDNWIFRNAKKNSFIGYPREIISKNLINHQFAFGFLDLLTKLLQPLSEKEDSIELLTHPFPYDLGSNNRKAGIWCYMEYLCLDLLPEIGYLSMSEKEKDLLTYLILDLMQKSLSQLDPNVILNSSACGIKDMDNIVKNETIIHYLQAHPGSAVLSSIYKNKVYDSLFKICNIGTERLNELQEGSIKIKLLGKSMKIIEMALSYERFLFNELVPILRLPDNGFTDPTGLGVVGLRSFNDALLLNLPLLANFALYVGSEKFNIVKSSLIIITNVTASKTFGGIGFGAQSYLTKKNLFLTMCETIDESIRIKASFIDQFESSITNPDFIELKLLILQYINSNLSMNDKLPTIAHFLLGFDTQRMDFGSANVETSIASGRSLLRSIVDILRDAALVFKKSDNFDCYMVKLSEICMEILLKLSKSDKTGKLVLNYLRTNCTFKASNEFNDNFILFLLENTAKIHASLLFAGRHFDGNINSENTFCSKSHGMNALISLINFRSILLQLIAVEVHTSISAGSTSLTQQYLKILTTPFDFASGSSKLLGFLDVLDFKVQNSIEKVDSAFKFFNYDFIFRNIKTVDKMDHGNSLEFPYDLQIVDDLIELFVKDARNSINVNAQKENLKLFKIKEENFKRIISCSVSFDKFKVNVFKYVSSWSLLVQVLVSEVNMKFAKRSNFILEIFQSITAKIDEYFEVDIKFAEELVSLCVHLLYVYKEDKQKLLFSEEERNTKAVLDFERLFPIFKVALHGIFLPSSTPSLRSDLYVLASSYLEQETNNKEVMLDLILFLKSVDKKVFDVICHDSLIGEGATRITALMLLESFIKIILQLQDTHFQESVIFDTFCKDNYLLLLVQKIKFTDELFCRCLDLQNNQNTISLQELLYELTCFKTNISLLIRIAQTRLGAEQLLRNDIFGIIKDCKFLQLDAELGFEITLKEACSSTKKLSQTNMVVSLDYPLGSGVGENIDRVQNAITYYEIFIPVFQLITTIIISLGPQNNLCLKQAKILEDHFGKLIFAVLKREILFETYSQNQIDNSNPVQMEGAFSEQNVNGMKELAKIFTLLNSLI